MLSEVASLALLGAFAAPGIAVLGRLCPFLTPLERIAHGSVLGIVVGTIALIPPAVVGGLSAPLVLAIGLLSLVVAIVAWEGPAALRGSLAGYVAERWEARRAPSAVIRSLLTRMDPAATVVIGALTVRWFFLWRDALVLAPEGLWAGHEYIWSDWPTHLGIVSAFAYGDNFPPEHTLFAGLPLSYHYLSDLTPAAFVVLGMAPAGALPLHSFVLSVITALSLYAFVRRIAGVRSIATLAVVLFLLGAGLGWIANVERFASAPDPIGALLADPWSKASQDENHIRIFNPYLAFLMSQRAYLYGMPLAMLSLTLAKIAVGRRSTRTFVLGGAVAGLLPLSHLPTLLTMAMAIPFVALLLVPRPWRIRTLPWSGWIAYGVSWVAVSLPQLLGQLGGGAGALSAVRIEPGWVAGEAPYDDSWAWFWLKNVGFLGILLVVGLFAGLFLKPRRPGGEMLPPRTLRLLLAFQVIFVAANLVAFQPWDWDNHKILVYWMLAAAIVSAAVLVRAWRAVAKWPAVGQLVARQVLLLVGLSIIAGPALENLWMVEGKSRLLMLSADQLTVAAAVRDATPPRALILGGLDHHDPVMMLSGRRLLMGYWGQLWVSGIRYEERQADIAQIYRFEPNARELLERYGVDYVVIGPYELRDLDANLGAFEAHYPVAARSDGYTLFAIDEPIARP